MPSSLSISVVRSLITLFHLQSLLHIVHLLALHIKSCQGTQLIVFSHHLQCTPLVKFALTNRTRAESPFILFFLLLPLASSVTAFISSSGCVVILTPFIKTCFMMKQGKSLIHSFIHSFMHLLTLV